MDLACFAAFEGAPVEARAGFLLGAGGEGAVAEGDVSDVFDWAGMCGVWKESKERESYRLKISFGAKSLISADRSCVLHIGHVMSFHSFALDSDAIHVRRHFRHTSTSCLQFLVGGRSGKWCNESEFVHTVQSLFSFLGRCESFWW